MTDLEKLEALLETVKQIKAVADRELEEKSDLVPPKGGFVPYLDNLTARLAYVTGSPEFIAETLNERVNGGTYVYLIGSPVSARANRMADNLTQFYLYHDGRMT